MALRTRTIRCFPNRGRLFVTCALLAASHGLAWSAASGPRSETPLKSGWTVQSDCKIHGVGAELSMPSARTDGWYTANVPATVLAVQVAAGEFKDPFIGTNLRSIPGTSYPLGENFSNLDMPADSPYHCGWWYRKTFRVTASERGKTIWLRFGGINYRADVWLNGQKIADSAQVQGAYRTYEFDVTKAIRPSE
jgi:exo-1,4-beta-D-glucosaminidase